LEKTQTSRKNAISIPIKHHPNPNNKAYVIIMLGSDGKAHLLAKSEILDVASKISD
jgi:hypothetical protein